MRKQYGACRRGKQSCEEEDMAARLCQSKQGEAAEVCGEETRVCGIWTRMRRKQCPWASLEVVEEASQTVYLGLLTLFGLCIFILL